MKSVIPAALLIAVTALTGCANLNSKSGRENVLFNPVIQGQQLDVSVMSNGCTEPEHFYLKVSGDVVELRRTQPDLCRAAPHLVRLSFTYPFEQGVYQIKNDIRYSSRVEKR